MPTFLPITEFLAPEARLENSGTTPVIDVRSPIEFNQAHIPGAFNIPLFDDEQRAEVGTLYSKSGKLKSILKGLEYVGPRMHEIAKQVLKLAPDGHVHVHCWRGGMRSRSVAWLLEQVDLEVSVLEGGYKAFRTHVLDSFKQSFPLFVLSGLTGSGKTEQLRLLSERGEQVIDLEAIANHRGSAFGNIGLDPQPTTESFENQLFTKLQQLDHSQPIWVEDESRNIGSAQLPQEFYAQLRTAPAVFMQVPREFRRDHIAGEYGPLPKDELVSAIERITKRMGGQNVKAAVEAVRANNMKVAIDFLLDYYDRTYMANKSKMTRDVFIDLPADNPFSSDTINRLVDLAKETACNL